MKGFEASPAPQQFAGEIFGWFPTIKGWKASVKNCGEKADSTMLLLILQVPPFQAYVC
jgi:hypothetical protein